MFLSLDKIILTGFDAKSIILVSIVPIGFSPTDATWNYLIDSEALIFDNFRGSFTIRDDSSTITFPYYYLDNFTVASVGLNPIGTIDTSIIDLATNPVRIILSNDKNTYQFVFSSNSDLNAYKSYI